MLVAMKSDSEVALKWGVQYLSLHKCTILKIINVNYILTHTMYST